MIVIGLFLLISCEKNDDNNICATTEPPADYVVVSIIDNEGNSLLGVNNVYNPQDITLSKGLRFVPIRYFEYEDVFFMIIPFYEMDSEMDYELKLNEEETDILNLKINVYNTDCFLYLKSVEKFVVNGGEVQFNGDFYEIRK